MLQDAFLDFIQPVMASIEDLLCFLQIDILMCRSFPWQGKQEIQIIADDVFFRVALPHRIEPVCLFQGCLFHLIGQMRVFDPSAKIFLFVCLAFPIIRCIIQLFLNGLHLFPQHMVAVCLRIAAGDLLIQFQVQLKAVFLL